MVYLIPDLLISFNYLTCHFIYVQGLVTCPLNDSITYDSSKGFELKVSNHFDPVGTYVCTAGFNNTYHVVRYTLIRGKIFVRIISRYE